MKRIWILAIAFLVIGTSAKAESWTVDPDHSAAHFAIQHMMIAKVRGSFPDITGTLVIKDGKPEAFEISIAVGSLNTGVVKRDDHLKSGDFFEAATYPEMTFTSTRVTGQAAAYLVSGKLTIKGVTRDAVFRVSGLNDGRTDPWGNVRRGGKAVLAIDRRDFGVDWNQPLDGGGFLIGHTVDIIVDFEILEAS